MNNESRTLWISLGAGLFAAFLLYSYSQEKKSEYDKTFGALENVVVAKSDISEMQTIDDTMLEVVQKPHDFKEPKAIKDPDLVVGQVAAVPIRKGEQMLETKLLQPGPDTGIALQVTPSKRAVTIPVDEVHGVAKLIRPGDRVDILAAVDSGKGVNLRREVVTLMSDVIVLATGINVMNNIPRTFEVDSGGKNINQISLLGDTKYTSVTLEVSPKEAQDLVFILSTSPGNLYFTLRNPNDRASTNTPLARMPSSSSESILGRPPMPDASAASQAPVAVPAAPPVQQQRITAPPTSLPQKKSGFRSL